MVLIEHDGRKWRSFAQIQLNTLVLYRNVCCVLRITLPSVYLVLTLCTACTHEVFTDDLHQETLDAGNSSETNEASSEEEDSSEDSVVDATPDASRACLGSLGIFCNAISAGTPVACAGISDSCELKRCAFEEGFASNLSQRQECFDLACPGLAPSEGVFDSCLQNYVDDMLACMDNHQCSAWEKDCGFTSNLAIVSALSSCMSP